MEEEEEEVEGRGGGLAASAKAADSETRRLNVSLLCRITDGRDDGDDDGDDDGGNDVVNIVRSEGNEASIAAVDDVLMTSAYANKTSNICNGSRGDRRIGGARGIDDDDDDDDDEVVEEKHDDALV